MESKEKNENRTSFRVKMEKFRADDRVKVINRFHFSVSLLLFVGFATFAATNNIALPTIIRWQVLSVTGF